MLLERLSRLEDADDNVINEAIDEFYEARMADDPPPRLVGDVRQAIDRVFSSENPLEIMKKLEEPIQSNGNAQVETWAKQTAATLRERSPTSVWVTQKALREARDMLLHEAFEMEMRLAQAYCVRLYFNESISGSLDRGDCQDDMT